MTMIKGLISALALSTILLSIIQPASAWAAPNHYAIVEEVYYSLPNDAQGKLNLSKMLDGADDPDYKFFDFQYHHYPDGQEKANQWLESGHNYYINGDYKQASYCFGVATHYLSDSVCPPHSGGGHPGFEHTNCEVQNMFLKPHITANNLGGNVSLAECNQISESAWENWIKTGDNKYIQHCLDLSADIAYLEVKRALST